MNALQLSDPASLRERARRALAQARAGNDTRKAGRALYEWYSAEAVLGSDEIYEKLGIADALARAKAAGDQEAAFHFTLVTAISPGWISRPKEATALLDDAERSAVQLGDPARIALVEEDRSIIDYVQNRTADAAAHLSKALALDGTPMGKASVHGMYSIVLKRQAMYSKEARKSFDEHVAELMKAMPAEQFPFAACVTLVNLAEVRLAWREFAAAEQAARDALGTAQRIGRSDTLRERTMLARALVAQARPAEALEALPSLGGASIPVFELGFHLVRAEALAALARPEASASLEKAREALAKFHEGGPQMREDFHRVAAKVHGSQQRWKEMAQALQAQLDAHAQADVNANENLRQDMQARYDVDLKERENRMLRASEAALQDRRRLLSAGLLAAVACLAAMALLFVLKTRQKRKLAELSSQLARSNDQLQALHASRTRLLASACHDLRQPAHALAMLAELAGDEPDAARRQLKLAGIRRCSSTLTDMLSMLMDMTQLEGGHYQPAPQPLWLDELLQEVQLQYGTSARRKGLQFDVASTEACVLSDRHMLRRIVFNLVANAVKYTPHGSVRVAAQVHGQELELTVQDTGPGIPPDRLDDVFADHVRLDASHDIEGLGIGLPIVKRAADLLGHHLQMESTPGEGTTVTLALPLAPQAACCRAAALQAAPDDTAGGRLVALVEDDTESREAMAALLQRWGFRVLAAADFQGLSSLIDNTGGEAPALLVTDLHLRGGNALDAVRQLRRRPGLAGLPVLLVTGDVALEVTEQARLQAIAVAHKPLMPQRLHAAVDQAIRTRGKAAEPAATA